MRGSHTVAGLRNSSSLITRSASEITLEIDPLCKDFLHFPLSDAYACASTIKWCGEMQDLLLGHIIHGYLVDSGYIYQHAYVEALLMNMYVKCEYVDDALSVFHQMHHPCVFAFNYTIRIYAKQGQVQEALSLFNWMNESGVLPNQVTYSSILPLYTGKETLQAGKKMHISISCATCRHDLIVGTALVNMYGKCSGLVDAERAFDSMLEPNVVTWTTMIALYAQHGKQERVFQTFSQLLLEGFLPNQVSFLTILSSCNNPDFLSDGKRLHVFILSTEMKMDVRVMNALMNMYGKCSSLQETREFFDDMPEYDVISYSTMIAFYSQNIKTSEAVELFEKMQRCGIRPNTVTFVNILGAFCYPAALDEGRGVHEQIQYHGYELHVSVANAIITMYGRCWSIEDAHKIFRNVLDKNVASWNSMIGAFVEQGKLGMALRLFDEMQNKGSCPDIFTFISLLKACTAARALDDTMLLHACICENGLEQALDVGASLINVYNKCNELENAHKVFNRMPKRNLVSWNCIIGAYAYHGKLEVAQQLFRKMCQERIMPTSVTIVNILSACLTVEFLPVGKELHGFLLDNDFKIDEILGSALINMYGKCGELESAREVFDKMMAPKVVSWTAIIGEYVEHQQSDKALQLFGQMLGKHILPDDIAYITILTASADQSSLNDGQCIHACVLESGLDIVVNVGNAIVNMYGKCGSAKSAQVAFNALPEHDVISWNSILSVYAQHGHAREALHHFGIMREKVMPDKITFNIVLAACSHAGLIYEGCECFALMVEHYRISPAEDHFVCIISLVGRTGLLHAAYHMIHNLPFQPTTVAYATLLAACQYDVGVAHGVQVTKSVIELDPETSAPYIILSNIHFLADNIRYEKF